MEKPTTRALVLGATGHIGQAVVRGAIEWGWQVTALTRRVDPEPLRGLPVAIRRVDSELRSLAQLAAGHDVLVDAAAPYPFTPGNPASSRWQIDVDSSVRRMEIVIDVARRNRMRLVYISSCTTLPRCGPPLEAAGAVWRRSISPYFEAKAAMEHVVVAAARTGLPAVVVNPAAFFGPWEFRPLDASFVGLVLTGRLPFVLNQVSCLIDVRDVAEGIRLALEQEMCGYPIPLSGHNIAIADLAVETARLAGLPTMRPMPLDSGMVCALAWWTQVGFMAAGMEPPPGLRVIPLIADVLPMERSPEQLRLGLKIRPLQTTLRDAIAFHQRPRFD